MMAAIYRSLFFSAVFALCSFSFAAPEVTVKLPENMKTTGIAKYEKHRLPSVKGLKAVFTCYYFPDTVIADFKVSNSRYLIRMDSAGGNAEVWKRGSSPLDSFLKEMATNDIALMEIIPIASFVHDRMMKNRLDAKLEGEVRTSAAQVDGSIVTTLKKGQQTVQLTTRNQAFTKKTSFTPGLFHQEVVNSNFDSSIPFMPHKIDFTLGNDASQSSMHAVTDITTISQIDPSTSAEELVKKLKTGLEPI